jgi:glucose-6-phosphate isomerase
LLPAVQKRLGEVKRQGMAERFWAQDPTLWSSDEAVIRDIRERLGWLRVTESMREDCSFLRSFAAEVRHAGFTHALLLGMGGSSLCTLVLRETFGVSPRFLDLAVLDSTDPAAIRSAESRSPLERTLFLVATKSGTTTETLSFFRYFFEKLREKKGRRAGEQFVAITDPGSPLVSLAGELRFRRSFLNPPDIGGRYSALSYFGLLPAELMGIDARVLLERAAQLMPQHGAPTEPEQDAAVSLGATLAELGSQGRDKVTFFLSPQIAAFGCWAEQLVAESTGKEGQGLLPVDGEPLGKVGAYGRDRVFVHLRLRSSPDQEIARRLADLERAGHPVLRFELADALDLGKEFFRWEIATAVAAAVWRINAFDEPNVQESKDNTARVLQKFSGRGTPVEETPWMRASGIRLCGSGPGNIRGMTSSSRNKRSGGLPDALAAYLREARPGDYVAVLAYVAPSPAAEKWLRRLRVCLRDALGVATTLGYGPRYLHSTGQLHKGGPPKGIFLQITGADPVDLPIPSQPYSFGLLKQAQAMGDLEALRARKRPILRVHLETSPERGLRQLVQWLERALPAKTPSGQGRRRKP